MSSFLARLTPSGTVSVVPLGDLLRLGSAPDNDVCISGSRVPPYHSRIQRDGVTHTIETIGGGAVTRVNGHATPSQRLHHLDVLTIAPDVDLVYLVGAEDVPRPDEAAPLAILGVRLIWLDGPSAGSDVRLERGDVLVGRDPSSGLVIDSPAVSRVHARIQVTGETLTVADAGSANGTLVNDRPITGLVRLRSGDRVTFGRTRSVRVEVMTGSDAAGETPKREPAAEPSSPDVVPIEETVLDLQWRARLDWSGPQVEQVDIVPPEATASGTEVADGIVQAPPIGRHVTEPADEAPTRTSDDVRAAGVPRVDPVSVPTSFAPDPGLADFPPPINTTDPIDGTVAAMPPPAPVVTVILRSDTVEHRFRAGRTTVGRGDAADVALASRAVSRVHAAIEIKDGTATVEDLGGQNGTTLNGVRVTGRRTLSDGDVIAFAELTFRVEVLQGQDAS